TFLINGAEVTGEGWHPDDEVRRVRLRPHFLGLALETLATGTAVEVPFPAHVITGLTPRVIPLQVHGRTLGVVCLACLPVEEDQAAFQPALIGQLAQLLAHRIAALTEAHA